MNRQIRTLILNIVFSLFIFAKVSEATPILLNDQGNLVYNPDDNGNIVPDFSFAGYKKSEQAIPVIDIVMSISPVAGDNTAHIQNAINQVAAMPVRANGFRGALLLNAGEYSVSGQIVIEDSGIVLRGVGQTENDTVIIAAGAVQRSLIVTQGSLLISEQTSSQSQISDRYVPVGTRSFNVVDASSFRVGQPVNIFRPGTSAWISDIGMDQIAPREDGGTINQWSPSSYNFRFEREITAINGNNISIDIPIVQMMEDKHGGGFVRPITVTGRVNNIGIENMLLVSEFEAGQETQDENHGWIGIEFLDTEHSWASDITARHFGYATASIKRGSRFITVRDSSNVDPVSRITGSRRYSFEINGSTSLVLRCNSNDGRHDYVTGSRVTGPNAFVYGTAVNTHSDIGPHQRWAMGSLYDNIKGGEINIQDRGNFGSGHGWAGAQQVLWNTEGTIRTAVQSPPDAINWSLGHIGPRYNGRHPDRPQGEWISQGQKVLPDSLFVKQLQERIGVGQAAKVLGLEQPTTDDELLLIVPIIVGAEKNRRME